MARALVERVAQHLVPGAAERRSALLVSTPLAPRPIVVLEQRRTADPEQPDFIVAALPTAAAEDGL
ncbi:hypothetical protein [Actinoplanes palleronii]|uniref:Uncharacterized protein n=1 Tax=Actinoplanes palleronii TaxID=113570 RepID=A0ABQ4BTK7_9ACTN|nr:hypothetical protein [Actinoplanes palleronii]GIE74019.1 hypothetical protein Apa02nite_101270 [Actinoplanes palleronii]